MIVSLTIQSLQCCYTVSKTTTPNYKRIGHVFQLQHFFTMLIKSLSSDIKCLNGAVSEQLNSR